MSRNWKPKVGQVYYEVRFHVPDPDGREDQIIIHRAIYRGGLDDTFNTFPTKIEAEDAMMKVIKALRGE